MSTNNSPASAGLAASTKKIDPDAVISGFHKLDQLVALGSFEAADQLDEVIGLCANDDKVHRELLNIGEKLDSFEFEEASHLLSQLAEEIGVSIQEAAA